VMGITGPRGVLALTTTLELEFTARLGEAARREVLGLLVCFFFEDATADFERSCASTIYREELLLTRARTTA
jgi:hypothetical protein